MMETKRPEVIVLVRDWEPGMAVQIVLVRPDEIVLTPEGGIDLVATPATSIVLLPGGLAAGGGNE